jgi:isocitrate dehydrogenase (NAD+)
MVNVTLITGDGIGPEIAEAARRCIDATGTQINWQIAEAGTDVLQREGTPLPDTTVESIKKNGVALKAPVTTPVGKGYRSINVHLRQTLDLYACLRPSKSYKGVRSRFTDIDLVVVRENTEGLYSGIEFQKGKDDTAEIIEWINKHSSRKITEDSGISIKPISVKATQRIVRFAFDYARKMGRKKVTSVHKANIMKFSDGLWLEVSRQVAEQFPDIEFEDRIVDNMCMQLIQKPQLYDVIVLPNLYGDIISDLCAGLVGGLGIAPGANIGDKIAKRRNDAKTHREKN